MHRSTRHRLAAFSLVEMLVVVAIIGIAAALGVPRFQQMQNNQRLRDIARQVGGHLTIARSLALQSGNNQIVFLATTSTADACGNPLLDVNGAAVPLLVLDDGPPGTGNCCIDTGETTFTIPMTQGVSWGVTSATGANPDDAGRGDYTTGSSFSDAGGVQTRWVMFRPDGIPVGLSSACVAGRIGSGGGGVYVTNTNQDFVAVLSPLGGVKVRGFDRAQTQWNN